MPRVQISSYSKFYHGESGTQFHPVLDQRIGCYVGVADVDDETAETLSQNPAFVVLSDEEFDAFSETPAEPEPGPSETGDPLTDQANTPARTGGETTDLTGPPAPPSR